MNDSHSPSPTSSRLFSKSEATALERFSTACSQRTSPEDYPLAASIEKNIPVYDLPGHSSLSDIQRSELQDEWYRVLISGPGVFVTKGLFRDKALIQSANAAFASIIEDERKSGTAKGDHFASAGKNDRIWNSFSKHGLKDPASFVKYYSNPYLGLISSAWLGQGYRITAQVNNTKPGASPQVCHRDYHVGFQTAEAASQIPRAMQVASQLLTLQGAVAHSEVPLESGPTRLLPFSQTFEAGYISYRRPEFNEYFLNNYVALPLEVGDGLFFNPALFHAAGKNVSTDVYRMANLLQISSPFGKPMESVDAVPLVEKSWDHLMKLYEDEGLSARVQSFIAAVAEGYPFPTNLDNNPPRNEGMAPESEQDNITTSLVEKRSRSEAVEALKAFAKRSSA
ncbi:phytanoyl-CoA dioxygenase family protein [Colletotrichum godetiae]|uniref:Phytanoyl-CoA dioxygenase family protein n=1 Tax=Colletotrichum godetiae TaxID=1209918 RepID=A0AAJ0F574_9PEZI|nr:phytanoyl-CoA dioxygenase family protein [Colletotrichum godetiae]KAK1701132.1 phytanoyl-CoA dioxygenase family protein [Colletotrichum godetiae]